MSLLNSFQIGLSGLSAQDRKLNAVSDNIANANNNGFKGNRVDFEEALQSSMNEHTMPTSTFAGVKQGRRDHNMTQGQIARTSSVTDMAISGEGFFELDTKYGKAYTRDGSFRFNKEGELVSGDGHKVMGYSIGENGQVTKNKSPIKININERPPEGTKNITMMMNLDIRGEDKVFDPDNPSATSNFQRTMKIYDNAGKERYITMYFTKLSSGNWQYNAMVDGSDAAGGIKGTPVETASGTLSFDGDGNLTDHNNNFNNFNFRDSGEQSITFDFGENAPEGEQKTTQYGINNLVANQRIDGSAGAQMKSIGFGPNGVLQTYYSDGSIKDEAQVLLADFTNKTGLKRVGSNLFLASKSSGQAMLGAPGEGNLGEVQTSAVELSNVAVNEEFIEMMKAQKAFNANSKAISTADELLQKVINVRG